MNMSISVAVLGKAEVFLRWKGFLYYLTIETPENSVASPSGKVHSYYKTAYDPTWFWSYLLKRKNIPSPALIHTVE